MFINKIVSTLSKLDSNEVFFGPQGFIVSNTLLALEEAQKGFSKDAEGHALSGSNAGDWQSSWFVIARDTELGDPYFVDINDHALCVYTAFLGDAGWEVESVTTSLSGFVDCMNILSSNGAQKEAQFVPDENTITDELTLKDLSDQLSEHAENKPFWAMFFRCYQDWLLEDE